MIVKKIYCLTLFLIFNCLVKGEKLAPFSNHSQQDDIENMLSDKVSTLIEVKQLDKELKKYKANASVWIYSKPTKEDPYYTIYVGYNGPLRYETRYNFRIKQDYINKSNFQQYVELWNWHDKYVPLLQWRKNNHKPVS